MTPRATRQSRRWTTVACAVAMLAAATPIAAQRGAPPPRPRLQDTPFGRPPGEGKLTFALTGDAVITQRLSTSTQAAFLRAADVIRNADVAFTNLEMLFHDYEAPATAEPGRLGAYVRAEPAIARELTWAGFDLVSLANDHAGDYGPAGVRLTRKHAEAAGLLTAGTGEDLREAREARFIERHNGRVALIATTVTFPVHAVAAPPRGAVRGRPGLSPLRVTGLGPRMLDSSSLEMLRNTLRGMGQEVSAAGQPLSAFGVSLAAGDESTRRGTVNAVDLREITAVIRNAAALSDYAVVSVHSDDQGAFLQTAARTMIDSGAAIVVGHGPHRLAGIEIYQGRPIFYSLGDFIRQDQFIARQPADAYARYGLAATATVAEINAARRGVMTSERESVIAVPVFEGGRLLSIDLHPIVLGAATDPPSSAGRPAIASGDAGRAIIERIAQRSLRYGTSVTWDAARGVGVVRVP